MRPKKLLYPVILVVLQQENSYGYEITNRLQEEFDFEQINPISVYQTLRQMEKEGLCEAEWEIFSTEGNPARQMYASTDEGEAYLDAWANACKEYQQVMESFSRVYRSSRTPRRSSQQQSQVGSPLGGLFLPLLGYLSVLLKHLLGLLWGRHFFCPVGFVCLMVDKLEDRVGGFPGSVVGHDREVVAAKVDN